MGIPSAVLFAFFLHIGGMVGLLFLSHTNNLLTAKIFPCHEQGLWMGIICGLSIQIIALVTVNARTNWDHEVSQFS